MSLKTKNHPEALRRAARENTFFQERVARIRQLKAKGFASTDDLIAEAKAILVKEGIHPQQIPATKVEADAFFQRQIDWSEDYLDTIDTVHGHNPDGSIWTEHKEDKASPYYVAHEIMKQRTIASIVPTLNEATTNYLALNAAETDRTPHNQKKHEQRVRRAVGLLDRGDKIVSEFNRMDARRHQRALRAANPTWSDNTLDRSISILSSIFASAIVEYELTITNPWLRLSAPKPLSDSSTSETRKNKRRSFNPEELKQYLDALSTINEEAGLIGFLMVVTGCRTMEAGGLLRKDLKLDVETPHMQVRFNSIRNLKTKNSVRNIPLISTGQTLLQSYVVKCKFHSDDAPLFPKYGRDGGMDPLSQSLNSLIRGRLEISDKNLVAYSSRHTMKDKLRKLRTPADIQHRLLGHGTKSEADGYGDGPPLEHLLEVLEEANDLTAWGC